VSAPDASSAPPFLQLDFLYTPSVDVAADMAFFRDVLGGRVVFAVEGMGARVAAVELAPPPPLVLLTDHVAGDRPILVFRVDDLEAAMTRQETAGWTREATFEIPHGPICSFRTPGGHRIALYQLTRPEAVAHLDGRKDF
jgi:catechol 2,3-dioxygenase-like lactoylglutathione lyase family enzyme